MTRSCVSKCVNGLTKWWRTVINEAHFPLEVTMPLQSRKCTSWCALNINGIIGGPFWFENDDENAVMINHVNYRNVIRKFCACLRRCRLTMKTQWFQQDGATPHNWADFNPLDFFLWGYAKDNVYQNNPGSIPVLKNGIEVFTRTITAARQ